MTHCEQRAKWKGIFIGILVGAAISQVSDMAYQDDLDTQARYCANVKQNVWPDYQKNFADICNKDVDSNAR